MANTKITMLGLSGSGKTCFIAGMWSQMASGIDGFAFVTDDDTRIKLQREIKSLRYGTGNGRFPQATTNTKDAIKQLEFTMNKDGEEIITFDIIDYAGGSLDGGGPVLQKVERSIEESTSMFILIDGSLFCTESKEDRSDNVKYDCAGTITPILDYYAKSHPGQTLPPIVFVVTKTDLWSQYVKEDEVVRLIKSNFSPVFGKNGTNCYICAISLGIDISDNDYSGRFLPINIHIPFFIGAYHEFYNRCKDLCNRICSDNNRLELEDRNIRQSLASEKKKWIRHKWRIQRIMRLEKQLASNQNTRKKNTEELNDKEALLYSLGNYLEAESDKFRWFVNGTEQSKFMQFKL